MFTYKTTGNFEKFGQITNQMFVNGQSAGSEGLTNYVFLFKEDDTIYCLKTSKNQVVPCMIKSNGEASSYRHANIRIGDNVDDATFAILSQSKITNEKTARMIAEMSLEYLTK